KCGHQEKKTLDQRVHICSNCGYTQQRDIASSEVLLLWYSNRLLGFGTNLADADDSSSTSCTRKTAGSMKNLGQMKRQKSQATLGDVETPGSNEVSQG
ncbi:zinc ribbon domain-containing protein, partial [Nostoc sp. FACHB-190]|uniref:zinc ribbon domain-containing protein n=1 Tax=Nostoc sp. FACHB-190 TaxID=2692838 RepID=UPI001683FBC0